MTARTPQPPQAGAARRLRRTFIALLASAATALLMLGGAAQAETTTSSFTVAPRVSAHNPSVTGANQGFSVESADFAHGFLTKDLMAQRLRTLSPNGVLRLGGYSMDLVWPAFGQWAGTPAPPEAIGGTVDQADLDALKSLLDASGWKVTLGLPLKKLVDPAAVKNPTRDPSPAVTLDQVVAEVVAAQRTLGDDLLSVEVGNEFDNITTLTGAQMWDTVKTYQQAVAAALPGSGLKVTAPSANTATTNTRLAEFVAAATSDPTTEPSRVLSELASHYYPGSHFGSSNLSIPQLMSAATYTRTQFKLDGIMAIEQQLRHPVPMVINESNSASCSGQPGVSNSYATSLWSLDYLLQATKAGIERVAFHTNTAAVCGDFKPRDSADYPISYRYYGAFCAVDQAQLDANGLTATPLYYGLWAFSQVPEGRFLDLDLPADALANLRAYALAGPRDTMTVVLINPQDPAAATSTTDAVTVALPRATQRASQVVLRSGDAAGLASVDPTAVTLGDRQVDASGRPTGDLVSTPVALASHTSATVSVAPGTATIVTFADH